MKMGNTMRSLIFSFVLFFTLCVSVAQAKFLNLNEIGEASCRVRVSGSAGSGTSIAADNSYVYILTNAHVVGSKLNSRAAIEVVVSIGILSP